MSSTSQVDWKAVVARLERAIVNDDAVAEREQGMAEAEAARQRAQRRDRLVTQGIALRPDVERAIVEGTALNPTDSLRSVQRWMGSNDVKPVIALAGNTGVGKSVAAAWAVANSHHGGHWRSAARVCRTFAGQFGDALEEQELLCECYLLVIDDLGAEGDHGRMQGALIELLDSRKRSAARTRTIITTNLGKKEFMESYPEPRLWSRLRESCLWVADEKGDDMRRNG